MSRSHGLSSQQDDHGRYIRDAKDTSGVTLTGKGAPHDHHAGYRHLPVFDSESDTEETTVAPDEHSPSPTCIISPFQGDEPILAGLDRAGSRVRFRSRVRISTGMRRRRRSLDGRSSDTSSISGSPCSSISAPLRTHYTGSNGWGTLGSRLKLATGKAAPITPYLDSDVDVGKGNVSWTDIQPRWARLPWVYLDDEDADDHTHLLTAAPRHSYEGSSRYVHDGCHDDREREQERWWREQMVDEAFGKWPARLLNRHWWWWHLEYILCCFCDPDDDE